MTTLYIPYFNDRPVSIQVNGHNLLILTSDEESLLASDVFDVEYALPMEDDSYKSEEELEEALGSLAEQENVGIVIAPPEVALEDIVENLKVQLPWLQ